MVGAPGFEPGTSCAQARRVIFSLKSFLCNVVLESKRLTKKFGSGKQYENVAPHAQGPPNFPHTWQDSRATPGVLVVQNHFRVARQEEFRNSPELFRNLAFSVWNLRLPQFDRIPLRVMQASEPAVGIRLRVNLNRDSRSL